MDAPPRISGSRLEAWRGRLAEALVVLRTWPWIDTARTLRQRFREDHLGLTAGSLTFTTLISVVPLFTVMLAIFSAFPMFATFQDDLEKYLMQALVPPGIAKPVLASLNAFSHPFGLDLRCSNACLNSYRQALVALSAFTCDRYPAVMNTSTRLGPTVASTFARRRPVNLYKHMPTNSRVTTGPLSLYCWLSNEPAGRLLLHLTVILRFAWPCITLFAPSCKSCPSLASCL